MKKNKIISPYFKKGKFEGVRVTLGDEDFVIAPKDYRDDKNIPYKLTWNEAMSILRNNNLDTWSHHQVCFTMAFCKEINRILEDNGGNRLANGYWTGTEYSPTCSYSFYCDDILSFDYKFETFRLRPIKNLKNT